MKMCRARRRVYVTHTTRYPIRRVLQRRRVVLLLPTSTVELVRVCTTLKPKRPLTPHLS